MNPIKVTGACARTDADLLANMAAAMLRGLPEVAPSGEARPPLIVAASGPSISGQGARILELKRAGAHVLAIRGAHDFLIEHGIIPDYATTVDPLPDSWQCFQKKHPDVEYWIAAQCPAEVFDHLKDCNVKLWYPYVGASVQHPPGKLIIAGGSTSGLRGLSVAYVLGYREFHLFGFDCCLSGDQLRVDGSGIKPGDQIINIQLTEDGEVFRCNPAMAHQAQQFESCYDVMPGAEFYSYGHGLITAIIEQRNRITADLAAIQPVTDNGRVSFIHAGGPSMASYRYRALIPARELGANINDGEASTLIFAKPHAGELMHIARAKRRGQRVIVDFCDDHFDWPWYMEALKQADIVTCPTEEMASRIAKFGRHAHVIPDPYEYEQFPPHCRGTNLLWFGHESNRESLKRILPELEGYSLRVVSNFDGAIPWSREQMLLEFARADIVILPATETYKSANRAVEAIRQGCFVVAEPHPAWNGIPGIWIGNIKEGIEWTGAHCTEARTRTSMAQSYVEEKYSPKTAASAWKAIIQKPTTSAAANVNGADGSMSIVTGPVISPPIYAT